MNIHVHIERLVLDGYSMTPAQRTAFQSAAPIEWNESLLTFTSVFEQGIAN